MYSVDAKGRAAIPAKMRTVLRPEAEQTFTVTRGLEQCIFAYPLDKWRDMEEEIAKLSAYDREARTFVRLTMMWAEEVKLDNQGRIGLPKVLVEYAGIQDKVLILGVYDRVEIWNPQTYEDYQSREAQDYETLAARVMRG